MAETFLSFSHVTHQEQISLNPQQKAGILSRFNNMR